MDFVAPESEINYNQGIFMVKLTLYDVRGNEVSSSSRPVMLTYRSYLVKLMVTMVRSLPLVTGLMKESESIKLPLIEEFIDGAKPLIGPVAKATIELESRSVQIYWADLRIEANLTGLRYYMVNWPLSTAFLGISVFFALYALITICSIDRSTISDDEALISEIHGRRTAGSGGSANGGGDGLTSGQYHSVGSQLTGDVDSSILSPDSTSNNEELFELSSSEADSTTGPV